MRHYLYADQVGVRNLVLKGYLEPAPLKWAAGSKPAILLSNAIGPPPIRTGYRIGIERAHLLDLHTLQRRARIEPEQLEGFILDRAVLGERASEVWAGSTRRIPVARFASVERYGGGRWHDVSGAYLRRRPKQSEVAARMLV